MTADEQSELSRNRTGANLETVLADFERDWQAGGRPNIDQYLSIWGGKTRQILQELVHTDLEYRLKAREPASVETYLQRYPEVSGDRDFVVELIAWDFSLRQQLGKPLPADVYLNRFPKYRAELSERLKTSSLHKSPNETEPQLCVVCPNCSSPVEVTEEMIDDDTESGVACPACGIDFPLDANQTVQALERIRPHIGRFQILDIVGRGTFGTVYRALDEQLGRLVAVKIPNADAFARKHALETFLAEARSAAQLKHPNIVTIYDLGRWANKTCYVVMEYVEGQNLAEILESSLVRLPEPAHLLSKVADAIYFAHSMGIIHRDLKPGNIMIDGDGEPHITDFGLAIRLGEATGTAKLFCGTPAFMSPEQVRGETERIDGRADIWSLGIILYRMLTGSLPFTSTRVMDVFNEILYAEPIPPRRIDASISQSLEQVCLKCLAKDPTDRYLTAAGLAEDLIALRRAPTLPNSERS